MDFLNRDRFYEIECIREGNQRTRIILRGHQQELEWESRGIDGFPGEILELVEFGARRHP